MNKKWVKRKEGHHSDLHGSMWQDSSDRQTMTNDTKVQPQAEGPL